MSDLGDMLSTRPSLLDSIPRVPGDPYGWHLRETTEDGYPLMGSSPAERAESKERMARLEAQAMRDHPFAGDGLNCEHRSQTTQGDPILWGRVTMSVICGYTRKHHPS